LIYFDTAYLAKCYLNEPGSEVVRDFLQQSGDRVASSELARAELSAVFHRQLREGHLDSAAYEIILNQYASDIQSAVWEWLPMGPDLWTRIDLAYRDLPPSVFLRGADAVHLVTAQAHGFEEVYTNDRHLLLACEALGLVGRNLI
jgi:predicted nucleic acid-binding protein